MNLEEWHSFTFRDMPKTTGRGTMLALRVQAPCMGRHQPTGRLRANAVQVCLSLSLPLIPSPLRAAPDTHTCSHMHAYTLAPSSPPGGLVHSGQLAATHQQVKPGGNYNPRSAHTEISARRGCWRTTAHMGT